MKAAYISDAMERIDEKLIIPVEEKRMRQRQDAERRRIRIMTAAAAACFCVIAAGALILPELTGDPATGASETNAPEAGVSDTDKPGIAAAPADEVDGDIVNSGGSSVEKQTLDDVVRNSYAFVFARCTGIVPDNDSGTRYRFETVTHLAGGEMPEEFAVIARGTGYAPPRMEEGGYYILPLRKSISVFFDEYERYYLTSGALFETDENGSITALRVQGEDIDTEIGSVSGLKAFLESAEAVCGQGCDDIGTKYTAADDLEGVCRDSDYILEVGVIGINTDFVRDRTSYDCRVLSVYKAADETDEIIDVTTPKSAMEIGQKYIIAINRVSEGSDLFTVSSRGGSVYSAGSPEAEEMIRFSGSAFH